MPPFGPPPTSLAGTPVHTDWRELIERDEIDLIDICTPGNTHAEIAIAALEAGKHVLCEKPLANTVAEAERMTEAAEAAARRGVVSMCGFSYRRTPALALAKRFVEQGRLGAIRQVRAQYLQDWRRPHHRRRPMDHRTQHHRRLGAAGNVREGTPDGRGLRRPGRTGRRRG